MTIRERPTDFWVSLDVAAAVSGWAAWDGTALLRTGVVRGLGVAAWRTVLAGQACYVLEGGYVGPSRRGSLTLARARGWVEALAAVEGVACRGTLLASAWRPLVGIPAGARRADAKRTARAMCAWLAAPAATRPPSVRWGTTTIPALPATEDECEAVLLGLAWLAGQGAGV